jgi:hypothetical protein
MTDYDQIFDQLDNGSVAKAVTSLDENPDTGARALALSKATGVPAEVIHGDQDGFEAEHRAALTAKVVRGNASISEYIRTHSMADVVSNDDYGNLDNFTRSAPERTWLQEAKESSGADWLRVMRGAGYGALEGIRRTAADYLQTPEEPVDFNKSNTTLIAERNLRDVADAADIAFKLFMNPVVGAAGGAVEAGVTAVSGDASFGRMVGAKTETEAQSFLESVPGVAGNTAGEIAGGAFAMREAKLAAQAKVDAANAQAFHDASVVYTEAMNKARPWLDAGQEPPRGVDPNIDAAKAWHNAEYVRKLGEHLDIAQESFTKQRSPEYFKWLAEKVNGDHEISIDGDRVSELYGDRVPSPDDGLLGWVPGIEDKLDQAKRYGQRVYIPAADLVTHMDPKVYKDLSLFMRAWEGGITEEESKTPWEPKPVVDAPMAQARAALGTEPMFAFGDKKLELKSVPSLFEEFHEYQFVDQNGKTVGELSIIPEPETKRLYVANINGLAGLYSNSFGPSLVRDLKRQLKEIYPEYETVTGHRVSGAREQAGVVYDEGKSRPVVKLAVDDPEDFQNFHDAMSQGYYNNFARGVEGYVMPSAEMSIRQAEVANAIKEEIARIAGPVNTHVVGDIRVKDNEERNVNALYLSFPNGHLPMIMVNLFTDDPIGYGRHEAIHHLYRSGMFDAGEWNALVGAAKNEGWLERYGILDKYPDLDERGQVEEAIAEGFRDWARSKDEIDQPTTLVTQAFAKIQQLWDNVKARLKEIFGRELSPDELFNRVYSGEVGGRGEKGGAGEGRVAYAKGEIDTQLDALRAQGVGLNEKTWKNLQELLKKRHEEDLAKSMKRAEKEQKTIQSKEWKENAREVEKQVEKDTLQRPDVIADMFIGSGQIKGEQLPRHRYQLNAGDLTPEQKASIPKHYYIKDGLPVNETAKLLGFPSGDSMLESLGKYHEGRKDLSAKERFADSIKTETNRRMEEKFGDLKKNIMLDAQDQAMSENGVNLVIEEWQAAAMQAGVGVIDKDLMKAEALADYGKLPVKAAGYQALAGEVAKHSKVASDFLINGDPASALESLERRARFVVQAAEAKKFEKTQAELTRNAKQSNAQFNRNKKVTIEPVHNYFVQQILAQVGVQTRRSVADIVKETTEAGFKDLEEFDKYAKADGKEMPIWPELFDRNWGKKLDSLTVDEYRNVANTVKTIVHNGKMELKVTREGEAIDLADAKAELIDNIGKSKDYEIRIPKGKSDLRSFYVRNLQMENVFSRWDGFEQNGAWTKYVQRDLVEGANNVDAQKKIVADKLAKLEVPKGINEELENPLFYNKDTGTPIQFTRKNLLAVMLNCGTKSNLVKLARGYHLEPGQVLKWVKENARPEEWDYVEGIWKVFEEQKARSDTMYRGLTGGIAAENIPGIKLQMDDRLVQGKYYPLIAHADLRGDSPNVRGAGKLFDEQYTRASTPAGYTQSRTGAVYPLSLDLDRMPMRLAEMIHDTEMRPAVLNAAKILYDPKVQSAVNRFYGLEYRNLLEPYLEGVANSAIRNTRAMATENAYSNFFRQNVIATLVGLNPGTVLKHAPTAAVLSMREVGVKNFAKVFAEVTAENFGYWAKSMVGINDRTAQTNWEFAMEHSLELQRRDRNWEETLYGASAGAITPGDKLPLWRQRVIQWSAKPVAMSDMLSAVPTWLAKYNEEMGKHGVHGDAVYQADLSVRRAHGSTAITSRTAIQRDWNPWLTSFYSFFSDVMNRQMETIWKAGKTMGMVKDENYKTAMATVPGLAGSFFAYSIWPAIVEHMVEPPPSKDDEPLAWTALKQGIYSHAASWPIVRDLASAMVYERDPQFGLAGTAGRMGVNELRDLYKVYNDIKDSGQLDDAHAAKLIQDSAMFVGLLTGAPGGQVGRTGKFIWNVNTGREEPEDPWEWMEGAWRGKIDRSKK